jgi:hypothetical protein
MRWLSLVLLSACWSKQPAPVAIAAPATPTPHAFSPPDADGRVLAIVEVQASVVECSNMGGIHYVLSIDGNTSVAHAGGHGDYRKLQGFYVAELRFKPRVDEDHDDSPDTSRGGWCLDSLPAFAASAMRLVPARDRADATRLLAELQRTGMPPTTIELAKTSIADTIGIARVREIKPDETVVLEPIAGSVPAWFVRPNYTANGLRRGDAIVIASDAKTRPTRFFIADSTSAAYAWAAEIRAHGWPRSPEIADPFGQARWTVLGKVIAGEHDCGLLISGGTGHHSEFVMPTMLAPAPPQSKVGDTVIAVVVPRFTPDRCGNTVRATRVYRAQGVTDDELSLHGIPSGLVPLVE